MTVMLSSLRPVAELTDGIVVSAGSSLQITLNPNTTSASCGQTNGSLEIFSSNLVPLEFSIDKGMTWQSSNIFENLSILSKQTTFAKHFARQLTAHVQPF